MLDGADFRGCTGLSHQELTYLEERGALIDFSDAEDNSRFAGSPQLRAAVALFALGVGAYLFTVERTQSTPNPQEIESELALLRDEDPSKAIVRYKELAKESLSITNKVEYLIEAAGLSEKIEDKDKVLATTMRP